MNLLGDWYERERMFEDPTGSSWALTGLSRDDAQGPRQHDLTCPVNETLSPASPSCIKASQFCFILFCSPFFGGFEPFCT